jgi:hypothetical protein
LLKPGLEPRLAVRLAVADPALVRALDASPLLTVVPADASDWEVEVCARDGTGG